MSRARWVTPEVAVVAAITMLAGFLRLHDLAAAPLLTDNADELQFTWAGIGMILHGDAYTWSYFKDYPGAGVLQGYGTAYPMVHHWLDHPPLFSLLMGGWALILGDASLTGQDPAHLRLVPAILSTATVPLTWALGRLALGRGPGLAGAVLLATGPGAVLMGREAEPEAVMAPLLLVALLLAWRVGSTPARSLPLLGVLLLICFAEPLFKVSGAAVGGIAGLVIVIRSGRLIEAAACAGAAALGLLAYVAYGWAVDWALFQAVLRGQAQNRQGLMTAYEFIAEPAGINRRLRDGWWILGWIGLGGLLALGRRSRADQLVALPVAAYLATILLLAGEQLTAQYGWYRVMLLPLVYLAAGSLCWRMLAAPSAARALVVLALGGAMATNYWLGTPGQEWIPDPYFAAALLAAVMLPAAAVTARRLGEQAWVARYAAGASLAFLALGNAVTSFRLGELFRRL